jgi:FAD/FMN-containing dehydrogenase/pimeloyl-ACP methyl ester carboxylesterase
MGVRAPARGWNHPLTRGARLGGSPEVTRAARAYGRGMTTTTLREQLLEDVPVAERRLEIAGTETVVLEGGDGPPLVLLHGPGAHGAHWARVLGPLSSAHRVIAPDLPGHGASDALAPLDAESMLAWLAELIERTCDEPPVLIGGATGGAIAARFAARHGDRIAGALLVDTLGLRPFEPEPEFGAALHAFMAEPNAETHDGLWRYCALDLDRLRADMGARWEPFAAYNLDRARTPGVQAALAALVEHFGDVRIPDAELAAITAPVTLIWGRGDRATPLAVAQAASARFGWPLHVIDGAADDPPVEKPEAFVAAVRRALTPEPKLEGLLLRRGDDGFEEASRLWNGMIERVPAAVVQPAGTADVVRAVEYAREAGLPVAVRGGGHNVAGRAILPGGLTIDMSLLREVVVDPEARTAVVQPGCLLADVDRATQHHGLATPLGFYSEVGVAGLTLGGGIGYLSRRFGWSVDNLLEVEIVTADGRVRRASRDENEDLFWAVRGAGANLGVVTSFTFRLHEVGPAAYGGLIAWPFERATEIAEAYRAFAAEAPRELAVWLIFIRAPAAPFVPPAWHGERVVAMAVCYTGDLDRTDEVLAPLRACGAPAFDLLGERPYTEIQSLLDGTEPKGHHYYWRSGHHARLSDELLAAAIEAAGECPIPAAQIGVLHLDGAIADRASDDGAVGNRDARFVFGVIAGWEPDEPREADFQAWVRAAYERVRPYGTGGSYVNFQAADEGADRVRDAYGANFDRVAAIKRAYDPEDLFPAFSIRDS